MVGLTGISSAYVVIYSGAGIAKRYYLISIIYDELSDSTEDGRNLILWFLF